MLRIVLLLIGGTLLIVLLWHLGPAEILSALRRIGWYFVPVFALGFAHHATRALALRLCLVRSGVVRYSDALAIRLSGEAVQSLTFTGPVLSQPTSAWLLQNQGLSLREGFAATIAEYLICAFVTTAMSIAGLLFLITYFAPRPGLTTTAVVIACLFGAFLIASAVAIVRRFYLIGTIIGGLDKAGILRGRLRPDMASINRMEDLLLVILRDSPSRFFTIALLEAAAQVVVVIELFWLLRLLEFGVAPFAAFVIEASVKVIGIVFLFVPLQLGVSEGGYAMVFDAMGLPAALGFAIAFVRRARTLAIAGIGLTTLALLTRDRRK